MRSREDNAIFTNIPIEDIEFYKKAIDELQQENKQLKEELDKYKRLIEYIKGLDFYEFELDYDYEENPVSNYYPADMEYHINDWLEIEEIDKNEDQNVLNKMQELEGENSNE